MMRIASVEAWAVKIPRETGPHTGLAGSPATLQSGAARYRVAETFPTVYSSDIETTLVRVRTEAGLTGWGEAQSPVAPEVTETIIRTLLAPLLVGEDALAPDAAWQRMYDAMRVRGHRGGFYLDAMAGIDIALWDLAGKACGQPVYRMLGGPHQSLLPCYISGVAGSSPEARMDFIAGYVEEGARAFKFFLDAGERDLLDWIDRLRGRFGNTITIYVDALWRLDLKRAVRLARQLEARDVAWLEAPLAPESLDGHAALARATEIPIAIGECYRTRFELLPFLRRGAMDIAQPDLGRTGITEGRKIAILADTFLAPVAPHLSIGLGPQIAAAFQFAAATANLLTVECNPKVLETANRYLRAPLVREGGSLQLPEGPGLGIEMDEAALAHVISS